MRNSVNKQMNKRILAVAAHPDDEVLGCGGTIARLAQDNHEVYTAILGEGITSRYRQRENADKELIESVKKQAREASNLLGAKELFLYDLPDNCFDTVPLLEIVKIIEDLTARLKPDIIYTHYSGDLNIDHVLTFRAVLTATRPMVTQTVQKIYSFEVASSTEWVFGQPQNTFTPNVFEDISATLEKKLQALALYESESKAFPHPRSPEAIGALSRYRGAQSGLKAAEAFYLVREIIRR